MQYLNPLQAKRAWEQWNRLSDEQRLTAFWVAVTLGAGVVFLVAQSILPENPAMIRYFLTLYSLNSLVFFLIFRQYQALGKTMLVFLVALEIVATLYYVFDYLSFGV
jgi:hypothetical protein